MKGPSGSVIVAVTFGAGLVTGLSHFLDPLIVVMAAISTIVSIRHLPSRVIALTLVVGTALGQWTAYRARDACASRLGPDAKQLMVRTIDPGLDVGRVALVGENCHGAVNARWPEGRAIPAGVTARVTAVWTPRFGPLGRPDGTLAIRRVERFEGVPGFIAQSRNVAADRIGKLFGSSAPLVDALLVGRMSGVDATTRDQFAQSGLIHLLSISGFHVGIIVGWVLLLCNAIGCPRGWGERAGSLVAIGYAAWLGWPAPVTRAAVMLGVLVVARWHQRQWRPDSVIGVALLAVLMIDPWVLGRAGAWLSFVAIAGVVWSNRWSTLWWPTLHPILGSLVTSVGATLATAPVSAMLFGRVALIGVALNLIAIPLTAVVVPAAALAVLIVPILPSMASALAASTRFLLQLLQQIGAWGSSLPGAASAGETGISAALPWLILLLILHLATRRRTTPRESARRLGWVAALVGLLTAALPLPRGPRQGELAITFLSVGQGDAIVMRTPHGRWVVIDAGPKDDRYDAGQRVVLPFLRRNGARGITLFVLSHGHRDHVGGAPALLHAMPVGLVIDPGDPATESSYQTFLETVVATGVPWRRAEAGESFRLDGVELRVLHPTPGWPGEGRDLNEDSLVLEIRFGKFNALLTGDAGIAAESSFLTSLTPTDLLKVGHHGSRTATSDTLLRVTRPQVAVISLGANNYGHPAPETLARLTHADLSLWRTDRGGPVTFTTDGRTFRVTNRDRSAVFVATDP